MAVGAMAALEAIKVLSRSGNPLFGRLTLIDGCAGRFSQIKLRRDPACPCCGAGPRGWQCEKT